jgi:hypothetical protein
MYCLVRAESLTRIQSILDFKGLQNVSLAVFVFTT